MANSLLNIIQEYFASTPLIQQKKDWKAIEALQLRGPNAFEYINQMIGEDYTYSPPNDNEKLNFSPEITPTYSGLFFFIRFAL